MPDAAAKTATTKLSIPTLTMMVVGYAYAKAGFGEYLGFFSAIVIDEGVVETGGDVYEPERQQWDSGNNAVALEPGVVVTYDGNTRTNTLLRKAGVEVVTIVGSELVRDPVAY